MENNLTREETTPTAEQYLNSKKQIMYSGLFACVPIITIDEAKEAIRLSKIEALKEAIDKINEVAVDYKKFGNVDGFNTSIYLIGILKAKING